MGFRLSYCRCSGDLVAVSVAGLTDLRDQNPVLIIVDQVRITEVIDRVCHALHVGTMVLL